MNAKRKAILKSIIADGLASFGGLTTLGVLFFGAALYLGIKADADLKQAKKTNYFK
jgi:hypothetical protein